MKSVLKLVCLVCLAVGALRAESYLVTFQAPNGQYLCAEDGGGGGGDLNANRNAVGPWEMFIVDFVGGGKISIRSYTTGMYWCATPDNYYDIEVNRSARGPWEEFYFIGSFQTGAQIRLVTHWYRTVYCQNNGGAQVLGCWAGDFFYVPGLEDPSLTLTILAVLPDWSPPPPPPPVRDDGGGGPSNEN